MSIELTEATFYRAVNELAARDPDLAQILTDHGHRPSLPAIRAFLHWS
ncbi:MAG: hypothetical protein R2867_34745 [Caldilineaceae bacterium]